MGEAFVHYLNAISVSVLSSLILILLGYNVYMFLIKKKNYRHMLHVVFYVAAFVIIVINVLVAWVRFTCDGVN